MILELLIDETVKYMLTCHLCGKPGATCFLVEMVIVGFVVVGYNQHPVHVDCRMLYEDRGFIR